MNCNEFHSHITEAVDRCLASGEMASFQEHARRCPPCRHEYEGELTTKLLVHNRARMVATPSHVRAAILQSIHHEPLQASPPPRFSLAAILEHQWVKAGLAVGLAAAVIILLVVRDVSVTDNSGERDVMQQSFTTYKAIMAGLITPQVVSDQPSRVKEFFSGKTEFPVNVPLLKRCTLVGGSVNDYSGSRLAHVVYRSGGTVVYLYQACWETVQQGERLQLSDKARAAIARAGWYTETVPDGYTIAVWTSGKTLCAAVAAMDKDDLIACVTEEEIEAR